MKRFYGTLCAISLLLIVTGCEDKVAQEQWNKAIDDFAGQYEITDIRIADGRLCPMDLNCDGVKHSDLLTEFKALPNYEVFEDGTISRFNRPDLDYGTGSICLYIPVQGLHSINGQVDLRLPFLGKFAEAVFYYNVSDDYRIVAEDLLDLGIDTGSQPDFDFMSGLHLSFPNQGIIQLETSCLLYVCDKKQAEKVRLQLTYTRDDMCSGEVK